MDKRRLEQYSSAYTLSDMELFIFPELLYAGLLANIMSPRIWAWREDAWFAGIERMNETQRLHRVKQYIMDNYQFNLDLETWGLTDKAAEIARFSDFIDVDMLKRSNALFGYEGDTYYFDIGIRKHFGLDTYTDDIIPYWKTETVEAMDAFLLKEGYAQKAGECVSLALLYAAAAFIVARVPLEKIFLLGTPLHSQNFIMAGHGILTNNRRIVTKAMWFNGTEISAKARRALENEKVTIVAHASGILHYFYPEASIDKPAYDGFKQALSSYLTSDLSYGIVASFLRGYPEFRKFGQFRRKGESRSCYVTAEKAFAYEADTKLSLSEAAGRQKILTDIECDETYREPLPAHVIIDDIEAAFVKEKIRLTEGGSAEKIRSLVGASLAPADADAFVTAFIAFAHCIPRLADEGKTFVQGFPIALTPDMERDAVIDYLAAHRAGSTTIDLSFHAYRDLTRIDDVAPFMHAALGRSPVLLDRTKGMDAQAVFDYLGTFRTESLYGEKRIAQPDECVNYRAADGTEKAVCMAVWFKKKDPSSAVEIRCDTSATVKAGGETFVFTGAKPVPFSFTL
ncbi:MAG: hypothetical protein AABZ39_15945 [Spirochaetota bacterium]